jgi:spoIIIJ-associated protein
MNAYERKLVHDAVGEVDGVESVSEGTDPDRFVVVRPA